MSNRKDYNFRDLVYKFRAKNGTVYLNSSNMIFIERKGWFDYPYQFFTRGETMFSLLDIDQLIVKEPDLVRGYMDFILKDNKKARVWLTHVGYMPMARKMEKLITERKERMLRKMNGLSKADESQK